MMVGCPTQNTGGRGLKEGQEKTAHTFAYAVVHDHDRGQHRRASAESNSKNNKTIDKIDLGPESRRFSLSIARTKEKSKRRPIAVGSTRLGQNITPDENEDKRHTFAQQATVEFFVFDHSIQIVRAAHYLSTQ